MKTFYEAIIAQGGFAGQFFDIAAGPANTDVIDILLSVGNGTLQGNAPVNLLSSGALGAARSLTLSGIEQNGRFLFISVQNSDINTNNLTITPTTSINGAATLVLSSPADYILVHETGGVWRAYYQLLTPTSSTNVFRASFTAATWTAGTPNNIVVIQSGAPGPGQIGPHGLPINSTYVVQVFRSSDNALVDTVVTVDPVTGNITLNKTGVSPAFNGTVIIMG